MHPPELFEQRLYPYDIAGLYDIWSLGLCLHAGIAGEYPKGGKVAQPHLDHLRGHEREEAKQQLIVTQVQMNDILAKSNNIEPFQNDELFKPFF